MSRKFSPNKRTYHNVNFVEALEGIIPEHYIDSDIEISGVGKSAVDEVINAHLKTIDIVTSVFYIESKLGQLPTTTISALDEPSGISEYFIKQNTLSQVRPIDFENNILLPLDRSFSDFDTSAELSNWLKSEYIPGTLRNSPTLQFEGLDNYETTTVHKYLVENTNWLYFLCTGTGETYEASNITHDLIVNKLYKSENIEINDVLKGTAEYVFKNYADKPYWRANKIIPEIYLPPEYLSKTSTYTSGTQQLDKWKTMIDVVYSIDTINESDTTVKEAIDTYFSTNALSNSQSSRGPFRRLLEAFSYAMLDISEDVEGLEYLYDIEECPDDYLPHLADLIGWKLYGYDPTKWRIQLANAVDVYKRAGTKESIQFALNNVFPRQTFDIESKLQELWESYIPNLIYYSIATESVYLNTDEYLPHKSNPEQIETLWNRELADAMKVRSFSFEDHDLNLRMVVDRIVEILFDTYPDHFILDRKVFPRNDDNFKFKYRGSIHDFPPWDEENYYVKCLLSGKFIDTLVDQLACFGVRPEFALEVGQYIKENTVLASDNVRMFNTWLMFNESSNYPPNWDLLLKDISKDHSKYFGLWSAKSSHFKTILQASDFDFAKSTIFYDSKLAPKIAAKASKDFSPAHAIPILEVHASASDDFSMSSVNWDYLGFNQSESVADLAGSSVLKNYRQRAVKMTPDRNFKRNDLAYINLSANIIDPDIVVEGLNRITARRRDFNQVISRDGYYDRGGFNGPLSLSPSTIELSLTGTDQGVSSIGFIPLGYIPSACKFQSIDDYNNIPDVYSKCEHLSSTNSFYGVDVSNTFPCRGLDASAIGSDAKHTQYDKNPDKYLDRCQLDPIFATMHSLKEKEKYLLGVSAMSDLSAVLSGIERFTDRPQSWANSSTEYNDLFPTDVKDYDRFKFGRGLHQVYNYYTKLFNRHHTRLELLHQDGANIIAHAFGSIFNNSNFDSYGSVTATLPNAVVSSVDSGVVLGNDTTLFTLGSDVDYGSRIITDVTSNLLVSSTRSYTATAAEWRNHNLIEGVDLIQTSGSSDSNEFTLYNLDKSFAKEGFSNYVFGNPMLKLKAINGLPRVKYSTQLKDVADPDQVSVLKNFFIPDHEFSLKVKYTGGTDDGEYLGGVTLGAWIHTSPEDGYFWSYNTNGKWDYIPADTWDKTKLLANYTHTDSFKDTIKRSDKKDRNPYFCIDQVNDPLRSALSLSENDFKTAMFTFNTKNKPIATPERYYKNYEQVHRTDQDYVIEIFMIPSTNNTDKFLMLDNIDLIDSTLNKKTMIQLYGKSTGLPRDIDPLCDIVSVETTKEEVLQIIKFFNKISGATFRRGDASRTAADTSALFGVSGGSRADDRIGSFNIFWGDAGRDLGGTNMPQYTKVVLGVCGW